MKLSVKVVQAGRAVEICFDRAGIDRLVEAMNEAMADGHVHLWSPARGGSDLDEHTPWGEAALAELILTSAEDDDD